MVQAAATASSLMIVPNMASAEVGTLPEFADTNAIIQGITISVADASQQDAMVNFLINGFDMKVLRKRIRNSVEETVGADDGIFG